MKLRPKAQARCFELLGHKVTTIAVRDWVWVDADTGVFERPVHDDEDWWLHFSLAQQYGIVHIRNQALYAMPKILY